MRTTLWLAIVLGASFARGDASLPDEATSAVGRAATCEQAFEAARRALVGRVPAMEHVHVRRDQPGGVAWRVGIGLSGEGLFYDADFTRLLNAVKAPSGWIDNRQPMVLRAERQYAHGWAIMGANPPSAEWAEPFVRIFKSAADRCAALDR